MINWSVNFQTCFSPTFPQREGRAGPGALLAISHGHTATVRHDWGGREGQSELFSQINSMFKEISEIVLKVLNNFLKISN